MANRLVYSVIAVAYLGLAGCTAEAHIGKPAEPAPAPAPAPAPPPPAPVVVEPPVKPVINVGKAKVEGTRVKIPGELEFDTDKSTLKTTPQSTEILTTLSEFMKQNTQVTKLRIEGHTDNTGTVEHNQKLSQERADAVVKYLGDHGIDKARLISVGAGATKPVAENDTPEHKALNRRTEFHVAEIDGKVQKPNVAISSSSLAGAMVAAPPPAPSATAPVAPGAAPAVKK